MPMPYTYRHASQEFHSFLADAKDEMNLISDNMAYTAIEGVFRSFRARLTTQQALNFANVLPAVARAIFVSNWQATTRPQAFLDRNSMILEIKSHRKNHNLTPDNCIEAVAFALWRSVNHNALNLVLEQLPKEAKKFWALDTDPKRLAQRFP